MGTPMRRDGKKATGVQNGNVRGSPREVTHCRSVNSSAAKPSAEPAAPAVLDAAEGHLRLVVDRLVVDVDDAGLQPAGDVEPPVRVAGEDAGGQPEAGGVGPADGVVGVVDDFQDDDRARTSRRTRSRPPAGTSVSTVAG